MASRSSNRLHSQCHVLDFFHDPSNSCALTVLQNGVRFHIIADHKNFDHENDNDERGRLSREYTHLIKEIRKKDEREEALAQGKKLRSASSLSSSHDSGIDVKSPKTVTATTDLVKGGFQMDSTDVEQELHNWMLVPFGDIFEELAPPSAKPDKPTVDVWYNAPTHFFDLKPDENGKLQATELESQEDLQERIQKLMPLIDIPKYIQKMDIPHFSTSDLIVTGETDSPDPFHPCQVEDKDGKTYFMKLVDSGSATPTKREISLLKKIEDLGLRKKINVPKVMGLVHPSKDAKTQLVGFLQSPVSDPTPLTKMLDEDISQRKREGWAREVERIKEILHENDIVFGDMKADNFLVDTEDKLWIIDFGGSYTEGWVDPEVMETEEGDHMGAEKIVNALRDPVNATEDTRPDAGFGPTKEKRKREPDEGYGNSDTDDSEEAETDLDEEHTPKKRKTREDKDGGYCVCDGPDKDRMIACDNEDCEKQWFHFECVGLEEAPARNEKWYCDACKE